MGFTFNPLAPYFTPTSVGPAGPAVAISGSSANVALSSDGAKVVLAQTVTGLGASKSYVATLGIRVSVWPTAALAKASEYDCVVTAVATTNGSSVATVAFLTTPAFDISLAHADMRTVACTVAASAGGFTISAARPTGVACKAAARWWIAETWREVTA